MPSLFLRYGSHWIEILPADYSRVVGGDTCELLFDTNDNNWVIGQPVLKGYYVIFDVTNAKVGFVP